MTPVALRPLAPWRDVFRCKPSPTKLDTVHNFLRCGHRLTFGGAAAQYACNATRRFHKYRRRFR
jgi:hypothetical protein